MPFGAEISTTSNETDFVVDDKKKQKKKNRFGKFAIALKLKPFSRETRGRARIACAYIQ